MNYAALLRITTPPGAALWLIVLLLLADSAAALVQPWIAGRVTDHVIAREIDVIRWWLLGWLLLLAVKAVLGFASQYLVGSVGERMAARLRTRVYEHLQVLPMAYFHQRRQGEVLALLTRDAEVISQFITDTVVTLLPWLVTFFGALAMMFWLDPVIAWLALVLLPVYYLAMKLIGRRIRPLSSAWIKSWSEMYSFVQENLGLLAAIKAFVREPVESERFADRNTRLLALSRRQIRVQAVLTPAVGFLAGAGLLLLIWVGAGHVEDGRLQTAGLVSLLLYAMLLTRPISALAGVYGEVQRTRGAADRLLECFAAQPEPEASGGQPLGDVAGHVRFEGVAYAYPGRETAVSGIDLEIGAGETVAVIGPNGAGKSTLAWLLMRYADPDEGRILIDGTDIGTVQLASLRARIGLVAQHTLLLNGPARDNIAYGNLDADEADIEAAARAAGAHDFISALPDGYATVIGDQGIRLSGGQRQRLSLARTLLKDPPIIILDEATAMFDPPGEEEFLARCAERLSRRTVIMITHRPVSLSLADRVVRMEHGRIVEG